jgi:hypothetical protein
MNEVGALFRTLIFRYRGRNPYTKVVLGVLDAGIFLAVLAGFVAFFVLPEGYGEVEQDDLISFAFASLGIQLILNVVITALSKEPEKPADSPEGNRRPATSHEKSRDKTDDKGRTIGNARARSAFEHAFSMPVVKQTMITPKHPPIMEDRALRLLPASDRRWVDDTQGLCRIYGIANSIDLLSAQSFLNVLPRNQRNLDVRAVNLSDLSDQARGLFANVTLSFPTEDCPPKYGVLTVPRVAQFVSEHEGEAEKVLEVTSEQGLSFFAQFFSLLKEQSAPLKDVLPQIERELHDRNFTLVRTCLEGVFAQALAEFDVQAAIALVGSTLDQTNRDWTHRDIDVVVILPEGTQFPPVKGLMENVKEEIRSRLAAQARSVKVVYQDGPVKVSPQKRTETWQIHVMMDLLEHVSVWPIHVKVRRGGRLEWLECSDPMTRDQAIAAIKKQPSEREMLRQIVSGGFGLETLLEIVKSPAYLYREIRSTWNSGIERVKKKDEYLFSATVTDKNMEAFWRDIYLTHYATYNALFNRSLYAQIEAGFFSGASEDGPKNLESFRSQYDQLFTTKADEFRDLAPRIQKIFESARRQLIFPEYADSIDKTQLLHKFRPFAGYAACSSAVRICNNSSCVA